MDGMGLYQHVTTVTAKWRHVQLLFRIMKIYYA